MRQTTKYSLALTLGLIFFFTLGNPMNDTDRTLSVFPYLLSLIPFPLVLYPLLRSQSQKQGDFNVWVGLRIGESVVRKAVFAFSLYVLVYGYFYFKSSFLSLVTASFLIALVGGWILGVAIAAICAWLVSRKTVENRATPAG